MKINFDITKPEYDIIKDILVGYLPQDCKIWVFGSRSKNKTRFNSDLDLAIEYVEKLPQKTLYDLKEAFTQSRLPYTVDIVDMNTIATDFKQIIEKQAIEFPIEKTPTTPKIRFPEFAGAWEEGKLGGITVFIKSGSSSYFEEGEFPIFGSTGQIGFSDMFDFDYPSILIARVGAKAGLINYATGKYGVTDNTLVVKLIENNDFYYIFYYLHKLNLNKLVFGSGQPLITGSILKNLKISLPSLPEQQKIADFLTAVDEKIGLLTKEHSLWQDYKKGMMQRIFQGGRKNHPVTSCHPSAGGELEQKSPKNSPPSEGWQAKPDGVVRFTDENGNPYPDWEEKKLGEVVKRTISKNKDVSVKFVLTNSATQGIVSQREYFDKDIANQDNLEGYYVVHKNDFVYNPRISNDAPVGPIKRNHLCDGVMSPLYTVFAFTTGNLDFFEYYFSSTKWYQYLKSVANFGVRHDRMNISNDDLFKMPLPFPTLPEQQKISDFLSVIDEKINLVKQQLDKTKEFKKGLLQKMFV